MTAKKDCTKTTCPLCERKCQAGSTNSGHIENNGACLQCLLGKTKKQIQALLLVKKTNGNKAGKILGIDLAKQTDDKGVMVIMSIDKENCIEKIDVVELNSTEIDNSCNCAACQHRKNSDEMKIKSPAYFKDYEPNDEFIRNENAYICDGGYAEEVTIKRTWQKPDGSAWVTFLSNMRMGFLDMRLSDFAKKYKAKPKADAPAPTKAANWTTPMPAPASDKGLYFYIVYSYFVGGRRGHKKGFIAHQTFNNEPFDVCLVVNKIEKMLAAKKIRTKHVLLDSWQKITKDEYQKIENENNE